MVAFCLSVMRLIFETIVVFFGALALPHLQGLRFGNHICSCSCRLPIIFLIEKTE
jgi:hypothetical protein